MARCEKCNKFMLLKSKTGYCDDCYNMLIYEENKRIKEEQKRLEEERRRKEEEEERKRKETEDRLRIKKRLQERFLQYDEFQKSVLREYSYDCSARESLIRWNSEHVLRKELTSTEEQERDFLRQAAESEKNDEELLTSQERQQKEDEARRRKEEEEQRRKIEEEQRRKVEEERRRKEEEERRQKEELNKINMYNRANELMETAVGKHKLEEAITIFIQLSHAGYRDSFQKLMECQQKMDIIIKNRYEKAELRKKEQKVKNESDIAEQTNGVETFDKSMDPQSYQEAMDILRDVYENNWHDFLTD